MRAVIQAVSSASVRVNGGEPRPIGPGLVILLGVTLEHIEGGGGLLCALPLFAAVGLGQTADFKDLIGHFVPASSQTLRAAM